MNGGELYSLDNCIKCSICTAHCPVAGVTGAFAGPKLNGPDLERFRHLGLAAVHPSIAYCSNCKSCDVACPAGVGVSAMNCRARAEYASEKGLPLRDRLLARAELAGKLCGLAPGLVNRALRWKPLRQVGEKTMGISAEMTFPRFAAKSFKNLSKAARSFSSRRKVVYFPGCYVNYNRPQVGLAVIDVLQRSGIQVLWGEFGCCGLPLISAGQPAAARKYARRNMEAIQKYALSGYPVLTSCPSCSLTLGREYAELFGPAFSMPGGMVTDVLEFLLDLRQKGELNTGFTRLAITAGYHQPCHLRAAGRGSPSRDLLELVPGCRLEDLDAGCCGLAGSYGFKKEKYGISMAIGGDLFAAIRSAGYGRLVTECGMCRLMILHGTGVQALHPVEILAGSYDGNWELGIGN
jgi:glycerol-3-phosphate dehydrogenase subunit C